ncbi:TadE/TadG family type IV pilus assembly protein [Cupriavidus basilensis]|uniref:TadE/TadG family type IV pilus assembly protein n=1 Tax=Cupriavidus basilensis TaxID=68895 RepID=UPI0039F6D0ED
MKTRTHFLRPARQRGATAVEFALIAGIFFPLLIGIVEFSRVLFYWNTAAEATRLGARMAIVCDADDAIIKTKMRSLLPLLSASNIQLNYLPTGCDSDVVTARGTCQSATVSISNVSVRTFIPLLPITLTMPPFTSTLSRESMNSSSGGSVCS